jgi:hypothetical protein
MRFSNDSDDDDDDSRSDAEEVIEYATLVGNRVSQKMLLYRS